MALSRVGAMAESAGELCEYERQRQENMRENQEQLVRPSPACARVRRKPLSIWCGECEAWQCRGCCGERNVAPLVLRLLGDGKARESRLRLSQTLE